VLLDYAISAPSRSCHRANALTRRVIGYRAKRLARKASCADVAESCADVAESCADVAESCADVGGVRCVELPKCSQLPRSRVPLPSVRRPKRGSDDEWEAARSACVRVCVVVCV
jgi:hypothetical protein